MVNNFKFKVDGVKTEISVAVFGIIWVLFEQIELFYDHFGLEQIKALFVLSLVLFVFLEHHEDFLTIFDVLDGLCLIFRRLSRNGVFWDLWCAIHI